MVNCSKGKIKYGHRCVNPSSNLKYKASDFHIKKGFKQTGDRRIPYTFISKDKEINANFFYTDDGDVRLRAIVGECGTIEIKYPFSYNSLKISEPKSILNSFLKRVNDMKYKNTLCQR